MSKKGIITSMIDFIEKKERELQLNKMSVDSQIKNDVVKMILDELERVANNED